MYSYTCLNVAVLTFPDGFEAISHKLKLQHENEKDADGEGGVRTLLEQKTRMTSVCIHEQ